MAGAEKGQKPALFSVPSSPWRARPILPLGSGKGDKCAQTKHQARACRKPHRTFSPVQSVSKWPETSPRPPRARHSCLSHAEAARLSLNSDVSHVCTDH